MPRKKNASALIPGIRLRKAMEKGLAIIGPAALQGIFDDLEKRGVRLDSTRRVLWSSSIPSSTRYSATTRPSS